MVSACSFGFKLDYPLSTVITICISNKDKTKQVLGNMIGKQYSLGADRLLTDNKSLVTEA